jgi:hypothetical protein
MKRQQITPASLSSPAPNSARKGLQQYCTPQDWATTIGAALPPHRRTIFDPFVGTGSLVRGLANDTTRDALGLDLDPTTTLGGNKAWERTTAPTARRHTVHGDLLDLLPLLEDTGTKFDLLALNPPFSLDWPLALLPEAVRTGIKGKSLSSTHATLRLAPTLLTPRGEALLIANGATIERLRQSHPDDFANVWLHVSLPSFYPGTDPALRISLLGIGSQPSTRPCVCNLPELPSQADLACLLEAARRDHFTAPCIEEPWHHAMDIAPAFANCADEMERRRNPATSNANIILDDHGRLRTWVSGFQQRSLKIPRHLADFLRKVNRTHPVELTIQPATRAAIREAVSSGVWTIDPPAAAAIRDALDSFDRDRAPLAPLSLIQRLGWIDEVEKITCTVPFHCFRAGKSYGISSATVEWQKTTIRPRFRAGIRDTEEVRTKGTDLKITIHGPKGEDHHFTYCPANVAVASNRSRSASIHDLGGANHHSLEALATHFAIPEVSDLASLFPEAFAANLALIDHLEAITP